MPCAIDVDTECHADTDGDIDTDTDVDTHPHDDMMPVRVLMRRFEVGSVIDVRLRFEVDILY